MASLSPVLGFIAADFAVPPAVVGLIGTAPPVCYAVFGILTPQLERRFGLERLALAAMVVVVVGLALARPRDRLGTLLLSTALIFAAVGVGNILLPPLVKKYFPDRIGLMTTIYSTTMAFATLHAAAGGRAGGGCRGLAPLAGHVGRVRRRRDGPMDRAARAQRARGGRRGHRDPSPQVFGRMWRLPLAWALVVGFAVSGVLAYTAFAWLPTLLVDIAGVSPATAGALLSLFAAMGLPASLLVPLLVVRYNATRALFGVAVVAGLRRHRRAALRPAGGAVAVGRAARHSRRCCSR